MSAARVPGRVAVVALAVATLAAAATATGVSWVRWSALERPESLHSASPAAPNPGTAAGFGGAYDAMSVAEARQRVPFRVLEPRELPAGYALVRTEVAAPGVQPPHVRLVYQSATAPARDLLVVETLGDLSERVAGLAAGTIRKRALEGRPAYYVDGLPADPQAVDRMTTGLVVERNGVVIQVLGWVDAGVDRAALERLVASLE